MFEITENDINLIVDDSKVGYILYEEKEDCLVGTYIYVIPEEREKGYSSLLIERFVELSKERNKLIVPTCPVIKGYIEAKYSEILK
ncbi:GNAT family N-acetyltransferase [Mycoplasmatota bacterium]|nr:GNAT family N-acetyltransferase [Mycoplasmatota bacterium]